MLLTPNKSDWDPHTTRYRDQEHMMVDYKWNTKEKGDTRSKSDHMISSLINRPALDIASEPTLFESSVPPLASGEINVSDVKSRNRKRRVSAK